MSENRVSDLAFKAVELGQTTFPELAASMGRVTDFDKDNFRVKVMSDKIKELEKNAVRIKRRMILIKNQYEQENAILLKEYTNISQQIKGIK